MCPQKWAASQSLFQSPAFPKLLSSYQAPDLLRFVPFCVPLCHLPLEPGTWGMQMWMLMTTPPPGSDFSSSQWLIQP